MHVRTSTIMCNQIRNANLYFIDSFLTISIYKTEIEISYWYAITTEYNSWPEMFFIPLLKATDILLTRRGWLSLKLEVLVKRNMAQG